MAIKTFGQNLSAFIHLDEGKHVMVKCSTHTFFFPPEVDFRMDGSRPLRRAALALGRNPWRAEALSPGGGCVLDGGLLGGRPTRDLVIGISSSLSGISISSKLSY